MYTDEMFKEDTKLANYVFKTNFKNQIAIKQDLIQCAIIKLWKTRKQFNNKKSTYGNYATIIIKQAMINEYNKEKRQTKNTIPIENEINENESILDIITSKYNTENNINIQYLINTIIQVYKTFIKSLKNDNQTNIIKLYIQGLKQNKITKITNKSRQNINHTILQFRKKVKEQLKKDKYF